MTNENTNTLKCISPVDGTLYAQRPAATPDEAGAAIDAARRVQATWAARPLEERIALVQGGVAQLGAMNAAIVPELAWMMGRPIRYGGEFNGVKERSDFMADIAETALTPIVVEHSDAFDRRVLREPHGVVFVIAPWNYPYMTAVNTVVPALIAGNAVVLKHATQTLLAGERMVHAFAKAGLPDGIFSNLFLDHPTTQALIAQGRFDFINFTGSVPGGQRIEQAAAGTFTGLGLELGGKDPGYVMDDADVTAAAAALIDGAMFNSGQSCCGIERIYVIDSLYDRFIEAAVDIVNGYRLGNPLDPETTIGPMAAMRIADTVRTQVSEAIDAGARPLIDPARFSADDGGTYVAPQILTRVDHQMSVMRNETFGPVVGIMKVRNDEEAVALMNDSTFGLTASLWTTDPQRAAAVGARVRTGTVFMNRADYIDPALCWTGCKASGRGGALSVIGYHNLTRPKSYHLKKRL